MKKIIFLKAIRAQLGESEQMFKNKKWRYEKRTRHPVPIFNNANIRTVRVSTKTTGKVGKVSEHYVGSSRTAQDRRCPDIVEV